LSNYVGGAHITKLYIGDVLFDDPKVGLPRNPSALDIEWWYEHRVVEYKIPGYKDMTQVTSNHALLHCRINIRTTDAGQARGKENQENGDGRNKFKALQNIIKSTGPYIIKSPEWGDDGHPMYLKGSPKFRQVAGEEDWVGVWSLEFVEKYDGAEAEESPAEQTPSED